MAGLQRKDLRTISEFTVDIDKVDLIEKHKEKIERIYEVDIKFDCFTERESKQWITVEGENIDRMSAKEYMLALCDPQEKQVFQIDSDVLDEDMLEQIEKQTNAVLHSLSDSRIEIRGTELAVILAMSSLEDVIGKHGSEVDVDGIEEKPEITKQTVTDNISHSHWSKQLDTSLQRALSQHSDANCSVDDYHTTSTSIKQVILNCINHRYSDDEDIDDSVLFAGHSDVAVGASNQKYKVPIFVDGRQINRSPVEKEEMEIVESQSNSNVISLSDQFNQTIISPEKRVSEVKTPAKKKDTPDQQYLRQFGLSLAYSAEEVEEGLEFVDEKTKPADFLELLSDIRSNKESVDSGENSNDSCVITSSSFPAPPKIDLSQKQDGGRRSLPDEYKQRLMKDFNEEHEHLSRAELKRRNEERQKMLQEAFESKQGQGTGAKEGKGRKRKNKNKHKDRMNSPSNTNQTKQNKGPKQNQQKGKQQTTSDGNISENKDEDQTCVLRIWENEIDDDINCSDSDCKIVGQEGPSVPVVYTNYKTGQNQTSKLSEQPWQQSSPSRHTWQQTPNRNQPWQQPNSRQQWKQQQSPRQQQFRQDKVVSNSAPAIMPLMEIDTNPPSGSGRDELRYIVIDGSNVAMTHGNGKCFSCKGIKIVIDYFIQRGHKDITAFVPLWRSYKPRFENPISDQNILTDLKESGHLVFTPSRRIERKLISSYDDRFVLELAEKEDGIIVSNDQYRDLMQEKASWRKIIEEKLLMYSFAKDNFMPPSDPLGRDGPCLDEFLRKSPRQSLRKRHLSPSSNTQDTPNVWKHRDQRPANNQRWARPQQQHFNHPQQNMNNYPQNNYPVGYPHPVNIPPPNYPYHHHQRNEADCAFQGHNLQQNRQTNKGSGLKPRSEKQTNELFKQLKVIFSEPGQVKKINEILQNHPAETDMEKLTNFCINAFC